MNEFRWPSQRLTLPSATWAPWWPAGMLACCGLALVLPAFVPSYRAGPRSVRILAGIVALLAAAVIATRRGRVAHRSMHPALLAGIGAVTVCVWNDGSNPALFGDALLYGWVLVIAFVSLRTRAALMYLLLVASALAVVLAAHSGPEVFSAWLVVVLGLGLPAVFSGLSFAAVERVALEDPLTGLFNRRAFLMLLDKELARDTREGSAVAVAMLDVNGLKAVNDQQGHAAGDVLLRRAAAAWQAALRREDVLARLGGDEFAVLLPGCGSPHEAVDVLDRMRASSGVSVSVGVALSCGEHLDALVSRADHAMYVAKRRGEHHVVVAKSGS